MDGGVVGVLPLIGVLEETEKHVDEIDEDISAEHALPEIPRVAHLREEVEEEHGSTVGVDDGVDTLVSAEETSSTRCESVRWGASKSSDGNSTRSCAVGEVSVTIWSTGTAEGAQHGCIVGSSLSGTHTNSHEGTDDGCPNREVGKPPKSLKCTNLAEDHTEDGDDEETDDEANTVAVDTVLTDRHLGHRSSKTEDEHSHQHEHLETLQNVDEMSHFLTIDAEEGLSKIAKRVTVGVHVHVDTPDVPARNGSHETKDSIESNTRTVTSVGESPTRSH